MCLLLSNRKSRVVTPAASVRFAHSTTPPPLPYHSPPSNTCCPSPVPSTDLAHRKPHGANRDATTRSQCSIFSSFLYIRLVICRSPYCGIRTVRTAPLPPHPQIANLRSPHQSLPRCPRSQNCPPSQPSTHTHTHTHTSQPPLSLLPPMSVSSSQGPSPSPQETRPWVDCCPASRSC